MKTENTLRIGALAAASGVSRDALRYYEKLGLLPRSHRSSGGFRQYERNSVDRIRFVKQAQEHGLTLREIRDLIGTRATQAAHGAGMCATCWRVR